MEKATEKGSFKISAEILQKNAAKASIRDLNAEFQRMGGKVIHKTSKKGDNYQLSHPNEVYLEEFRVRLFRELGLLEEKAPSEKEKGEKAKEHLTDKSQPPQVPEIPKAPPPRYGDKYSLRRGWNVRSPSEFKQGRFNREDVVGPDTFAPQRDEQESPKRDKDDGERPRMDERPSRGYHERDPRREHYQDERVSYRKPGPGRTYVERTERPRTRSSNDWRPEPVPESDFGDETGDEDGTGAKSFDERWGDTAEYMEIVAEALNAGAVDDGDIIRFSYQKKVPEERIKKLKKLLWDSRCRGSRNNCPHGKKKFRFEELMKVCSGEVEGWENIDSPFIRFVSQWEKNMEAMYGPFRDREVEVEGKISSFKPVYRKGHEHLKLLVYDTLIKDIERGGASKLTRKYWVRITIREFNELTKGFKVHVEDHVKFKGRCILDSYFHDYWIIDIKELQVIKEGGGEVISTPRL